MVDHRYAVSGSEFMTDDTFRRVWFEYANLLALDGDMRCSRCGPYPETVIWDGVTLAFGQKHLTNLLRPPTRTSENSITRSRVKYHASQQLLTEASLRAQIRLVLQGPVLDDAPTSQAAQKRVAEHFDRIEFVYNGLKGECALLASMFLTAYGAVAYSQKKPAPKGYNKFFSMVSYAAY
jgi:hypothetical protein